MYLGVVRYSIGRSLLLVLLLRRCSALWAELADRQLELVSTAAEIVVSRVFASNKPSSTLARTTRRRTWP